MEAFNNIYIKIVWDEGVKFVSRLFPHCIILHIFICIYIIRNNSPQFTGQQYHSRYFITYSYSSIIVCTHIHTSRMLKCLEKVTSKIPKFLVYSSILLVSTCSCFHQRKVEVINALYNPKGTDTQGHVRRNTIKLFAAVKLQKSKWYLYRRNLEIRN